MNWIFFPSLNWIFAGYTGSKNQAHQTCNFKIDNVRSQVQIDRDSKNVSSKNKVLTVNTKPEK
jgi:hypothetical protein